MTFGEIIRGLMIAVATAIATYLAGVDWSAVHSVVG